MLNMVNGSIQSELGRFFQVLKNSPITTGNPSPAAFCKARKKFSFTAFKELTTCLTTTFYETGKSTLWNGLRLLAVDGSVTTLPAKTELYEYFGKSRSFSSHPSARLSQLYDISNKLSIDVQVAPHSTGERELAIRHLECASEGDVVLYVYGQTELGLITANVPGSRITGSVGRCIHATAIETNSDGEILVNKTDRLTIRYFQADQEDIDSTIICGRIVATGYIGKVDDDGFLHLIGRKKNAIITKTGEKFHPEPVESLIEQSYAVSHAVMLNAKSGHGITLVVFADEFEEERKAEVEAYVAQINQNLDVARKLSNIVFVTEKPSVDNGLLTRNLKINRANIQKYYL